MSDRLVTPRFLVMCGFTFTVFLSQFQLLPTAPFRIQDLGGTTFAAGLFLGCLTYASATSAPFTGAIADRIGRRRTLLIASAVSFLCSIGYGLARNYAIMLLLVVVHGVFWSGLLSASAAYLTNMLPERRRAEGIAYWGLSSVASIALAPPLAFWMMERWGWTAICVCCAVLNVVMGVIAWALPDEPAHEYQLLLPFGRAELPARRFVEWRVLALSLTLFLYSFGYGAITSFSAMFADALGVTPKSLYLTLLAVVILLTRPLSGTLADRIGYRRVFVPCLALIAVGLALLAAAATLPMLVASAVVFGIGFGTAYPVFVAYIMRDVHVARRGAAFGAILAAFDTGIGTGSTTVGWLIERVGFARAFGVAAMLSAIALPYFMFVERRMSLR
ncbi:MAG TPA: MFS transporter [Vicinamibacterales bacterium]|nr:MFS transporter [Vicinamibacterales bacterium]